MKRLAFLWLAGLAACGDGEKTGPLRVEIVVASADGAAPPGTALRSADGKRTLPLVPSKDSPASLSADGPAGKWFVVPPEGWGVVGTTQALSLQPGLAPTPVPIGKRHSIYLVPPPSLPIGDVEVLPEVENASPLSVERAGGADGRVALRVPPEAWHDVVRVTAVVGGALISRPSRVTLAAVGAPVGAPLYPDTAASLDVRMFRPEDGKPASGVEVVVEGALRGLKVRSQVRTDADGIARLSSFSAVVPYVTIREALNAPGLANAVLWPGDWRLAGEARCLTRPSKEPAPVVVEVPNERREGDRVMVQVRPDGGTSYAMVDSGFVGLNDSFLGFNLLLPTGGRFRVFVSSGDGGGFADLTAKPGARASVSFEPLSTLRVKVAATQGVPHGVRVVCRRKEGGEEVLAQGWSVVAALPSLVDVHLPLGTYRICVLDGTHEGPSVTWTFDKPGSQAQIDLVPP